MQGAQGFVQKLFYYLPRNIHDRLLYAQIHEIKEEMKGKYAVLFGIGGGRGLCYTFFAVRNTKINLFEECNINRFKRQKKWFVPFDEFKKFPENIVEQLVEKKLVDN